MSQLFIIYLICLFNVVQIYSNSNQQFALLGNFKLVNGQIVENCKIGYRTFGQLDKNRSNVILYPTWFGGTSAQLANLIGPGKLVNSDKYFVIAIDALGNGISSSPSNSVTHNGSNFPEFTIHDMVQSQYELLTKHLGIKKVFAIVGGSMGGMQTFDWIVSYPEFMEKAIPYVGTPQLTSYDLFLFSTQLVLLEMGLEKNCPKNSLLGAVSSIQRLAARTPTHFVNHNNRESFPEYFQNRFTNVSKVFTAENYASQLRAMINHDITIHSNGSMELAAQNVD